MKPIPEQYEVMDTHLLAQHLGYTYSTLRTHLAREMWDKIPEPSVRLATGPLWYRCHVEEWQKDKG